MGHPNLTQQPKMQRLPFALPNFSRLSWVSDLSRGTWEPRFNRMFAAWMDIELLSVVHGIRRCAVFLVTPRQFAERSDDWLGRGLRVHPLETLRLDNYSSSHGHAEGAQDGASLLRCLAGRPQDVDEFLTALSTQEHREVNGLLGWPLCCFDFLSDVWVNDGLMDTTWPMALATLGAESQGRSVTLTSAPETNILWRWMGLRAVPHLPCSFSCPESIATGKKFIQIGHDLGYGAEMRWLVEILSWPVQWSALHGIAEIKTPILKVVTNTDATPVEYRVRRTSDDYPAEDVRGLDFPFRPPAKRQSTPSKWKLLLDA